MKAATRRQEEVLDFVKEFLLINKYPPTIREIADHFELSVMGAYNHVKALSKKGLIRSNSNKSRSIEVIQDSDDESPVISVPILGRVAAGAPIMAEENFEGNLLLTDPPPEMYGQGIGSNYQRQGLRLSKHFKLP